MAHEFKMSLLSLADWKQTTPIGLSTFATSAFETTISDKCFSASWKDNRFIIKLTLNHYMCVCICIYVKKEKDLNSKTQKLC